MPSNLIGCLVESQLQASKGFLRKRLTDGTHAIEFDWLPSRVLAASLEGASSGSVLRTGRKPLNLIGCLVESQL